jgi:hypothetical protein
MSDTVKLWCFLLLLPFFLVVGHDLYANYYADEGKRTRLEAFDIDPTAYQSSDLGYLVVKYLPGVYENLKSAVGEENWIKWADPVLRLYSFVVALIPALLFFIWLLISRIFDIWPFAGSVSASRRSERDVYGRKTGTTQSGQFKYKRR